MDEEQTEGVGDRHNGTGIADAARWHREADGAERVWSSVRAALEPTGSATSGVTAQPRTGERTAHAHAPGLDDETPPGGTPTAEPPLWREAARHARASAPPARWEPQAPAYEDETHPEAHGDVALPGAYGEERHPPPHGEEMPPAAYGEEMPPAAYGEEALPAAYGDAYRQQVYAGETHWKPEAAAGRAEVPPAADAPAADELPPARAVSPVPGDPVALGDLPRRVPSEPDVPHMSELADAGNSAAPPAGAPQLARIADQLRRDDVPSEDGAAEDFDADAVLDAVKTVAGVRSAALRTNPHGAHTLRLDLSDDADPVQVSRVVARLLQERMGLSAAPQHVPHPRTPPDTLDGQATGPAASRWAASPARHSPVIGERPEVEIDQVQVHITGRDATVEVRLAAHGRFALGLASGPAIDSYVVRLAAVSAAKAIDELMREAGPEPVDDRAASRCFVEHTGVVPFGSTEVAVVVVLLVSGGHVQQLSGSALVDGDSRHAAVRATLGAVHRRLDALLAR